MRSWLSEYVHLRNTTKILLCQNYLNYARRIIVLFCYVLREISHVRQRLTTMRSLSASNVLKIDIDSRRVRFSHNITLSPLSSIVADYLRPNILFLETVRDTCVHHTCFYFFHLLCIIHGFLIVGSSSR